MDRRLPLGRKEDRAGGSGSAPHRPASPGPQSQLGLAAGALGSQRLVLFSALHVLRGLSPASCPVQRSSSPCSFPEHRLSPLQSWWLCSFALCASATPPCEELTRTEC